MNPYESPAQEAGYGFAANAAADARTQFLARTYVHLLGAILALVGLEALLFQAAASVPAVENALGWLYATPFAWIAILFVFGIGSGLLDNMARNATTQGTQWAAWVGCVVIQSLLLFPLLYIASIAVPGAIASAAVLTALVFTGLTAVVLITKKDFSFLLPGLTIALLVMMGVFLCVVFFGLQMSGAVFSGIMIVLMAGYILYYTSQVLRVYRTDQYVAASVTLFLSVATLFWYILQFVMSMSSD